MVANRSLNTTMDRMMTLNRALDQAFAAQSAERRVWIPAIDVVEKRDAYVMHAELPGVSASQFDISFEQNVLTIRGTKPSAIDAAKDGELRVYAAERVSGAFERSLRLPEFVDGEHIEAELANGILTVTIPKAQAAQPRKIEVKSASVTAGEIG